MNVVIRKIKTNSKDNLVFYGRSGFKFESISADPKLTDFQAYVFNLITEKQGNKNLKINWHPYFCYMGSAMYLNGVYDMLNTIQYSSEIMNAFNNHFEDKNTYQYNTAKPDNIPKLLFFSGIRMFCNTLAYYYELRKVAKVDYAIQIYKRFIVPTGFEQLLSDIDSLLVSHKDFIYKVEITPTKLLLTNDVNLPIVHEVTTDLMFVEKRGKKPNKSKSQNRNKDEQDKKLTLMQEDDIDGYNLKDKNSTNKNSIDNKNKNEDKGGTFNPAKTSNSNKIAPLSPTPLSEDGLKDIFNEDVANGNKDLKKPKPSARIAEIDNSDW